MPVSINNTQVVFNDSTTQTSAGVTINGSTPSTFNGTKTFSSALGNVGGYPSELVRAWLNANKSGGAVSIRASANISSASDSGVGRLDVRFSSQLPGPNAPAAGNYSLIGTASLESISATDNLNINITNNNTSNGCNIQITDASAPSFQNPTQLNLAWIR